MKKEMGLYVHIPFCRRKCAYCDFPSFAGREGSMEAYADRLTAEIKEKSDPNAVIATLYIGGGTPSLLPPGLMARILGELRGRFEFLPGAECTCECNPGTVTADFLRVLKQGGINRLSFGVQARQERLLRLLGRIHSWEQAVESVSMARDAGFQNLNLDLMLGLPGQTLSDVEETLDAALRLSPTHLSCYGLIVEEGTKMQAMVESGKWLLPDEDTERAMYETCRATLARNGYAQYEISNFALPGYACRHNMDCWRRKEYIGVGSAACGFADGVRYRNPPDLDDYLAGKAPEKTVVSPEDARFESVMLGLRMTEGVSEEAFFRMHGVHLWDAYGEKLQRSIRLGLVIRENGFLRLTRRGMDVQNSVLVDLL